MRPTDDLCENGRRPGMRGMPAADDRTYLETATLTNQQRFAERADQLQWWCELFGTTRRAAIDSPDIRRALNGLLSRGRDGKPLAASTVNKYRFALSHVYTVLDGKEAANPLRNVPLFQRTCARAAPCALWDHRSTG